MSSQPPPPRPADPVTPTLSANDRPIFILGCPRSGTTLLSAMLHSHPRIAVPPETRFLLSTYRDRVTIGDLRDPANLRHLAERITRPKRARFRDLGLNRHAVIEQIVAGPPTLGSAFAAVWTAFARARGKPRWGEKRPAYWRAVDAIRRLFPDAQIVHLMRDPRSCVASMTALSWWPHGFDHAFATWLLAERELRRFREHAPPDAYHLLRYEDLLTEPRGTLERLCAFLDEDFAEQMLDHTGAAADMVPEHKVWHDRARGGIDLGRSAAWREALSPRQIGLIEAVARRPLHRYGYSVSGCGARPTVGELAACSAWIVRTRATLARDHALERLTRLREQNPVAALPAGSSTGPRHPA